MSEQDQTNKDRKGWIGSALALMLTAAIVVAVFWQTRGTGSENRIDTNNDPPRFDQIIATIEDGGEGNYRVVAGPMVLQVFGKPASTFEYRMRIFSILDEDSRVLAGAIRMLTRDPGAQKAVDATPEQMEKIYALQPPRIVMSDDARSQVQRQWAKWEKASDAERPAAQEALLSMLGEVCKTSIESTRKAWVDAGVGLKNTLTLQQMAKLAVYEQSNGQPPWNAPPVPFPASQPQ